MKHLVGVALLLGLPACWLLPDPNSVAEMSKAVGWARATSVDVDNAQPVYLGPTADCRATEVQKTDLLFVFVHGIGGLGPEWRVPMAVLGVNAPVYVFRWLPFQARDAIVEVLSAGVTTLLRCSNARRLVVLAHSAGGVVASFAAARMAVPITSDHAQIDLVTVASPLAGTRARVRNADGSEEARFILDLGSAIREYPPTALNVSVTHFVTHYPPDEVMKPNGDGYLPNDPNVGVPGAQRIDIPNLDHDASLAWVAEHLTQHLELSSKLQQ